MSKYKIYGAAAGLLLFLLAFHAANAFFVSAPQDPVQAGDITTTEILDGTIVNADVSASAAIAASKLSFTETNLTVGIGTSTPRWLLQIASSTAANSSATFAISDTGAGANLKHWLFSSMGGNLYIGTSSDSYATSTPPALSILSSGNIGLGIASPAQLLHMRGETPVFRIQANSANQNIVIQLVNSAGSGAATIQIDTGNGNFDLIQVQNASLRLLTNSTEWFRITGPGKVGIASTSPAQGLSVGTSTYITGGLGVGVPTTTPGNVEISGDLQVSGAISVGSCSNCVSGYERITATGAGPTTANTSAAVSANCTAGKKVLGGGGSNNVDANVYLNGSYAADNDTWTVVYVASASGAGANTMTAYAVCGTF